MRGGRNWSERERLQLSNVVTSFDPQDTKATMKPTQREREREKKFAKTLWTTLYFYVCEQERSQKHSQQYWRGRQL